MERDWHYHAIAVLARAAGFSQKDALTIAWSSEYADSATDSTPIDIGQGLKFDPVRSAHVGLEVFNWSVQKRVLLPFHFLPPKPPRLPEDSWRVMAGGYWARGLLNTALSERGPMRLPRIGIALHTLADSWAHADFTGRHARENNVSGLEVREDGKWRKKPVEEILLNLVVPECGHGEAGFYPDISHVAWRARVGGRQVERSNPDWFLESGRSILLWLVGNLSAWPRLEPRMRALLERRGSLAERCAAWRQEFADLFPDGFAEYDADAPKREALALAKRGDYEGFYESLWVQWHRAALRQRHQVLENFA